MVYLSPDNNQPSEAIAQTARPRDKSGDIEGQSRKGTRPQAPWHRVRTGTRHRTTQESERARREAGAADASAGGGSEVRARKKAK